MGSSKFFSRKFIVTLLVITLGPVLPIAYKHLEISETVMLAVLALVSGVGIAYGVINTKDKSKE